MNARQTKIRACVWDLGGVIRTEWEDYVAERLVPRLGIDRAECDAVFKDAWKLTESRSGDSAALEREWAEGVVSRLPLGLSGEQLAAEVRQSIRFLDRARTERTLRWLMDAGIVLAVASNDNQPFFEHAWRALALERYFDRDAGLVFISCYMHCTKSEPGFFEAVADRLACAPRDVLFIDDRVSNVRAAQETVGFSAVLVPTGDYSPRYTDRILRRLVAPG